jgi:hypothetical protein
MALAHEERMGDVALVPALLLDRDLEPDAHALHHTPANAAMGTVRSSAFGKGEKTGRTSIDLPAFRLADWAPFSGRRVGM